MTPMAYHNGGCLITALAMDLYIMLRDPLVHDLNTHLDSVNWMNG